MSSDSGKEWMKKIYGDVYTLTHNPQFPPMKYEEFMEFKTMLENDDGWKLKRDKYGTKVMFKNADNEEILQLKLKTTALKDFDPAVIHDVIQDPAFRSEWDKTMNSQHVVEQVDENTEIGYYAVNMPFMLTNRDWVNYRSWWFDEEKGLYIIVNHSVKHEKEPELKGFRRANSLKSGYIIEKTEEGSILRYFTWNGWNGNIPVWCVNTAAKSMLKSVVDDLIKACQKYPSWKAKNYPEEKYWMNEGPLIKETKSKKDE